MRKSGKKYQLALKHVRVLPALMKINVFQKARRKALECDIIITNHHLLLNDLYIRNEILTEKENYEDTSEKTR